MAIEQQKRQEQRKANDIASKHSLETEVIKGVDSSGLNF